MSKSIRTKPELPESTPGETYLVGGAVRDAMLNIPSKDKDWVVTKASPEQMIKAGFQQVGADFPVFLHPKTKQEYALARTERKQGSGYHGFICDFGEDVTLEQDLERRDLSINAMAQSSDGKIIDPYGGQADLESRTLRHVSPAFSEDPLRVLRVARFAARFAPLGFTIAPETLELMRKITSLGELSDLSAERVWSETQRALLEKQPSVYFETLRHCGALSVLMPELDALFGIPQPEAHHPEIDCGKHALLSLQQATLLSDSASVRFAALIHDLGKAKTPSSLLPKHHGHEKAGLPPIKSLCQRLKAGNYDKKLALLSCEFHTHVHRAFELRPQTLLKVIRSCDAFRNPSTFEDMLVVCEADAKGRTGLENKAYPQANYFREALQSLRALKVEELISQGFKGKELGSAIDDKRIEILAKFKDSYPH